MSHHRHHRTAGLAVEFAEPARVVARAYAAPFRRTGPQLPDGGGDRAIQRATVTRLTGVTPNVVSAIGICMPPGRRGGGPSALMLAAMRPASLSGGTTPGSPRSARAASTSIPTRR